jgi:hypothetical protein
LSNDRIKETGVRIKCQMHISLNPESSILRSGHAEPENSYSFEGI